jgi:hypothetical protein
MLRIQIAIARAEKPCHRSNVVLMGRVEARAAVIAHVTPRVRLRLSTR